MSLFVKDRKFYLALLTLAAPTFLQNIFSIFGNLINTLMLAKMGEVAYAASSLATQPFTFLTMFTNGIASGAMVLASQYWGKQDLGSIRKIADLAIKINLLSALGFVAVSVSIPEFILGFYTDEADVIRLGAEYMRIIAFSYFATSFTNAYINLLRSVEVVKIAFVVVTVSSLLNVFLNWVLIFGKLGFPRLGILGAALSTLLCKALELTISVVYLQFYDKKLRLSVRDIFQLDTTFLRDIFRCSSIVVAKNMLLAVNMSIDASIWGKMGAQVVAANSMVSTLQSVSSVLTMSLISAVSVLIGKSVGEQNVQRTMERARTIKYLTFCNGLISAFIVLSARPYVRHLYEFTPETEQLSEEMMLVLCFVVFFQSFAATGLCILQSGGDLKGAFAIEIIGRLGFAIPLELLAGRVLHLHPCWVLALMRTDELVKFILCVIRTRKSGWIRDMTRTAPQNKGDGANAFNPQK